MRKIKLLSTISVLLAFTSCAYFQEKKAEAQKEAAVISETQKALNRAVELTMGWPQSSTKAAAEMIAKYGEPHERTQQMLIWNKNISPFKKIIVHRMVVESKFPLLHQNALEHVVDYKININKVDDALRFNKSLVFNKSKGELSSFSDSEAMNILSLNLTDKVMRGIMGAEAARVKYGKAALDHMNGKKEELTQVLNFGEQFKSADPDEAITSKIRWIDDPDQKKKQAQEEKPADKKKK